MMFFAGVGVVDPIWIKTIKCEDHTHIKLENKTISNQNA